jgi:hypothetical protein
MSMPTCPFHVECQFYNCKTRTPSDTLMGELFCYMRYEGCEIVKRMLAGKPVPAGACPDGNIRG